MIADFWDREPCVVAARADLARSKSARVRPAPNAPTWRKSRRDTPSQNLCAEPRKRNMVAPDTRFGLWMGGQPVGQGPAGSCQAGAGGEPAGCGVGGAPCPASNRIFTSGRDHVNRKAAGVCA